MTDFLDSCDTMVALPGATAGGNVVFAKNSDRPQEECQPLVMRPAEQHPSGSTFEAQFVGVPQAQRTYRHVGSRPWWCLGYEHGFNERQVVIGNEALPSRVPTVREPKLVGMEILRLALERSASAAQAVDVITGLVERHGQGKFENSAGVRTYDNIYLAADPVEGYIIECAGHDWAVKRVGRFASISNLGMIGRDADRVSKSARTNATRLGLYELGFGGGFSFADAFADRGESSSGIARQCRSNALLGKAAGGIDARTMVQTLSDHADGAAPDEPWAEDVRGQVSLCLHRTEGDRPGTTAASLVADLCADGSRLPVYWCAFYSPCMSLYFPVFIEGELPAVLSVGAQQPDDRSPWWDFYRLTHSALREGPERRASVRAAWRPLQEELFGSAYIMARRARELIDSRRRQEASDILTRYMAENTDRMISKAREFLRPVGAAAAGMEGRYGR
jgi:dipeptidase